MVLGQGVAYVKGYEVRKIGTTFIDLFKARDFETDSGLTTRFAQLPFVNITNLFGTPDVGFVSDETEVFKKVRLLDTEHTTRGTALVNNDGTVFDIGRAKTRGIEYNSGSATGVFMSSATVTSNTYKHYMFDTVMFAHLNVLGAASGALTTGETLTGGTSGATGIVESITSLGAATITGVTAANPAVVTCSGGHNFTEGQQITIASVSGMTDINTNHTVKNPTATTLELHQVATSINSTPRLLILPVLLHILQAEQSHTQLLFYQMLMENLVLVKLLQAVHLVILLLFSLTLLVAKDLNKKNLLKQKLFRAQVVLPLLLMSI